MKKIYAVKIGRTPGIYFSWEECKEQTDKFHGAIYRSFPDVASAENYLNDDEDTKTLKEQTDDINEQIEKMIANSDDSIVNAFVDGSVSSDKSVYSYGVLLFYTIEDTVKRVTLYKSMKDEEGLKHFQFAGEIKAAIAALKWAIDKEYKHINIFYDYAGIEHFATGYYKKANNVISKEYVDFIKSIEGLIKINFHKIESHSGIKYNDEVDALAKRALTEKGFRTYKDGSFYVYGLRKNDWISIVEKLNLGTVKDQISIAEDEIKDGLVRLTLQRKDEKLTISIYHNSTSYMQGKQTKLIETLILESIDYLDNTEDIREFLNRYHAIQIETTEIEILGHIKMPDVNFRVLQPKIRLQFECVLYNYLISANMPEFSSLITPSFKISEFYLHHILGTCLGNTTTINGKNNFGFFSKNSNNQFEYNGDTGSYHDVEISILNELYNFYNKTRHIYSHWSSNDIDAAVISSMEEARLILDEAYVLFDKCHSIFYT
jgi:ribonuclease HI